MAVHRKAVALMDPIEAVARLSARAGERAESAQTRASGSASYDNGDGTRTVIGPQTGSATMATHVGDVTPPGRPMGVAGASSAGVVYVAWGGELDGGTPADFDHVSVYMSVEGVSELVGTLTEAGIVSTVPMATTATVEVWATAEDDCCLADGTPAHNVSEESDHATVAVTQGEDAAAVDALRDRVSAVEAKADGLSTLIREDGTGITVGKSADGKTYSTGRTHMDEDSFDVLDKAGNVLSSFGKSLIELGKNSANATISMLAGLAKIAATRLGGVAGIDISSGSVTVRGTVGGFAVSGAFPGTANGTGAAMVEAVLSSEIPTVIVSASETDTETGVTQENRVELTPDGFELSRPDAMRSAIGLGNTTGALPVANGGTGATTAAAAFKNLSGYTLELGTNNTSDTWVPVFKGSTIQHRVIPTLPFPVSAGGTGATDAAGARANLGLGFKQLYYDYDAGWVVYASDYLVWIYAWGVYIGSGSWDSKTCPYVLPQKYRPSLSHITTPVVTNNGRSCTSVLVAKSDGTIRVSNRGGSGSDDARYGVLFYPVGV